MLRATLSGWVLLLTVMGLALPAAVSAQVREIDPNAAIDADLAPLPPADTVTPAEPAGTGDALPPDPWATPPASDGSVPADPALPTTETPAAPNPEATPTGSTTYQEDDLIGAAEGVFGKGARGLASVIQDILRKQGQPNAYISGREGSGALVVGARYGSGTLFHKVEGQMPVYWRGPSIGFDAGANAASTFVLVYNLYDSADLFETYVAGEGAAYFIGGFNISYIRRKNVVLIPIRLGVGARLGVNAGYMKFSREQNWLPF